ncbi:acyltransferase family protein [Vibrio fluvialis]|uniref:acyltransferase family protein n=1 Tax=Vibrio fluvialis TaxID=676 RepID=UPI001F39CB7F|nr:acyltransferase [Vibrio fluvialis]MCE7600597.1 acyltransferase [Vibrio fluvialis]
MSGPFSYYLDILRFFAAIAVFFDHVSSYPITNNFFWKQLGAYGSIAVIVFFVLSGYVIAYVTSTREKNITQYASARIARVYSVVLVALVLTFVLDNIGSVLNPEFYSIQKIMWKPQSVEGYLASLFFVNEYHIFNFNGISPGSNGPYWSLSFEVTYYVLAGSFIFLKKEISLPIIAIILLLSGSTIAVLFPIWILGYMLYFVNFKTKNRNILCLMYVISLALVGMSPLITKYFPHDNFGFSFAAGRSYQSRNIIADYFPAIFFAINLICAREILSSFQLSIGKKVERMIRWLGGLTFPLYLIHFPALAFFASISPWESNSAMHVVFISLSTIFLVIAFTPTTDRLKHIIKKNVYWVFSKKITTKSDSLID